MPVDPQLRSLNIDIPAQPEALVKLSLLLADDNVNLQALSALVASDMALASAVLKAVNSSLYGLRGRVQTVQQAITHLGTREVAATQAVERRVDRLQHGRRQRHVGGHQRAQRSEEHTSELQSR